MGHGGLALCCLALCVSAITLNYEHSPIFDRPTQSCIIGLSIGGAFVFLLLVVIPQRVGSSAAASRHFIFSFRNQSLPSSSETVSPIFNSQHETSFFPTRKVIVQSLVPAGAISIRVELFRIILRNRQCTLSGVEGLVPFVVAIYDYLCIHRRQSVTAENLHPTEVKTFNWWKARYVLPAALLTVGSILTSMGTDDVSGALLDCFVLMSIEEIMKKTETNKFKGDSAVAKVVASVLLLSAAFLFLGGLIMFVTHPGLWTWIVGIDRSFVNSLTWYTSLLVIATLCFLETHKHYGLVQPVFFVTFTAAYASGCGKALFNHATYIHTPQAINILSIMFLFLGAILFLHITSLDTTISYKPTQRLIPHIPSSTYTLLAALFILRSFFQLPKDDVRIPHHPIDFLLRDATVQSDAWLAQASRSKTLEEAAAGYRRRYQHHPPPGFDAWYNFATNKSSVIIDDFDSIMKDLRPFWARKPSDIRYLTRFILSDEWNDIAEISIRSGKAEIGPKIVPTHRWMLEGVLSMLEDFVQWLPDMDLAFNINDEPRVAVRWKELQQLRRADRTGDSLKQSISNEWSSDRAKTWQPWDPTKNFKSPFTDRSLMNSFTAYGSVACPPSSPSRTSHLWDPRNLCISCAAPHSLGVFLHNWTLSASPCHQPDLRHLHGFYISPAAFKPSHELLPVFSQSKSYGYADILYPSPWNYMDKVKYEPSQTYPDPPFESKQNTLFWRGATSEALSKDSTWKGMARQRFVHVANNATAALPILTPHPTQPDSFTYDLVPPSSLPTLGLNFDVAIVDDIVRCWDSDCTDQAAEFGLVDKCDFQAHWGYRFLMDLDGAGFSGRFLPFLRSRSVVFKTALFREWWNDRLTAWRHFVPVDVRFHGLLSTLAYFAGTQDGRDKGGFPAMKPNVEAGARIAEDSRLWADRVLRKEDMQIYMFRLLLEWGRLTDDRRDEIGYHG